MTSLKLHVTKRAVTARQAENGNGDTGNGDLWQPAQMVNQLSDKQRIAASFSAAARTYDAFADVQQEAGVRLLNGVTGSARINLIADIGCGTGWLTEDIRQRFPGRLLVGVDLAKGMIDYALKQRAEIADAWWVADMEALPICSNSCDLLVSNLAMQWLASPNLWFKEAMRVLRPAGQLVCSTLLPGTLSELEQSWQYADHAQSAGKTHSHVNSFNTLESLRQAASIAGFSLSVAKYRDVRYYPTVRHLMTELKSIGAHNINNNRPHHITGKNRIRRMLDFYEKFRSDKGYPATYEVALLTLNKL